MAPARIVVMGVSGCGKSTVGERLAQALGCAYVEGDDFHPPRNITLMAAGTPLSDADRQGWLEVLAEQLHAAHSAGRGLVLSCSALKRVYRDVLRSKAPGLVIVHIHGSRALLAERMAARVHRYMPASLLASQLDTLEPPQPDENTVTADAAESVERIVQTVLDQLESRAGLARAG